ncbi:MAG: aminodeoxychorismate synthase component I [Ectothiorhodospiraceae bacterium]|nr:aminodeoxychorismate synthase component I [Ectothiorhodospiraceae bacterium]
MEFSAVHAVPYQRDTGVWMAALRRLPMAVWLDSGVTGRWDILSADPVESLVTRDGCTRVRTREGLSSETEAPPLEVLKMRLARRPVRSRRLPFCGGAIGAFGYDLGEAMMPMAVRREPASLPIMSVGLYDWAVLADHAQTKAWLVTLPGSPMTPARWRALMEQTAPQGDFRLGPLRVDLDRAAYGMRFRRLQAYIRDGDCYQVNLARRFSTALHGDPFAVYLRLRAVSPAPHGAYLEHPDFQLLSISPERFLRVRRGYVETRPIKGTRPRGENLQEDLRLAEELQGSSKDRAENVMIVDLLRNDLGKVCRTGSVRAGKLFDLETHPSVHHLVSRVSGRLRAGLGPLDALEAAFPGGSITGAPKRRAMEIIAELETASRGFYCGSVGYVGYDGSMDTNICIRTAVHADGVLDYRAGGGVVADSEEEREFEETDHKARAFLSLLP